MLTYEKYSEHRDKQGMTDYKMSVLTGIAKSTFSDWKHGKSSLKLDNLLKIAKVLKLAPSEIVSRDDIKSATLVGDENG